MKFIAESSIDYMNFRCAACGGDVRSEFLGYDPAVPRFHFSCTQCSEQGEFKMQFQLWSGLPQKPSKT